MKDPIFKGKEESSRIRKILYNWKIESWKIGKEKLKEQ